MKYFLSIGSNIEPEKNIDFALEQLDLILDSLKFSSTHRTASEGFDGDDFLNLAVSGYSDKSFNELNSLLKGIEDKAGRDRNVPKFSSRSLDIDIVIQLDNDQIIFESEEVEKYSFVSEPLKEII